MRRTRPFERRSLCVHLPLALLVVSGCGGGEAGVRLGGTTDAGVAADAAGAADAAMASDAGSASDASVVQDAGSAVDASVVPDAGSPVDASVSADAAAARDSGSVSVSDAGSPAQDGGGPAATCQPAAWVDGRPVHGNASPLVREDPACGLTYGRYAARGASVADQLVPDFSFAGYEGGGVALPLVGAPTVAVSAVAGDNRARIQAALDTAAAQPRGPDGFRAVVVLAPGTYEVDGTLYVRASGVVIRGAGQSPAGTVIVATKAAQHELLVVEKQGLGLREQAGTRVAITTPAVAVGSRSFEVANAAGFVPGDEVAVVRTPNQAWINALGMGSQGWTPSSYELEHGRRITAVAGNRITVDAPLVDALTQAWGGGSLARMVAPGELDHCGVEDLRLESRFAGPQDEAHGWNAVTFKGVRDGWVRRVTSVAFGYAAVELAEGSRFNTVEEVAQLDPVSRIDGGRRYSFYVDKGAFNLFQRCYVRNGRHNFVTGGRVVGPNVWVDCASVQNHSDEGPHHRWATGMLLDNVRSEEIRVQNRSDSGSGHGWAGAQTMFWNVAADRITSDAPLGAMNWVVGGTGTKTEGSFAPGEPFGIWEQHGSRVAPRSLYFAQLRARKGAAAVEAVTTPAQRAGTIWHQLEAWAGQERLDAIDPARAAQCSGLLRDEVCCALACGTCGGTGCASRPGGSSACCLGSIRAAGRSCAQFPPPCVVP